MSAATIEANAPTAPITAGYLAGCNIPSDEPPALIVNPDATALGLLGWCWGEVACLKSIVDALAMSEGGPIEIADLVGAALHRLEPLKSMLGHVITRVAAEGRVSASPGQGASSCL